MTHPERVNDYLEHIVGAIQRATRYVRNSGSLEALEKDEQAQDAIIRTIAVIGEAANRIQKMAPEFVTSHPEIPWSQMRGIRKRSFTTTSMSPGTSCGILSKRTSRRCWSGSGR